LIAFVQRPQALLAGVFLPLPFLQENMEAEDQDPQQGKIASP